MWPSELAEVRALAARGDFDLCLTAGQQIAASHGDNPDALLSLGALLLDLGFLSAAKACFERIRALSPGDFRPLVNLANVAREAGDHAQARGIYDQLCRALPDHPVVRRNALVGYEYNPGATDSERLAQAQAWGAWAQALAGGPKPRPPIRPLGAGPLRIGYVSADLCHHTVGLFLKDVLRAHDPIKVKAFAYSAGALNDWVTDLIRGSTEFRNVATLSDAALADLIRGDQIDVLIDLSGHTAGSRLTVFAHRPAPVQVSWLGYFATTGLSCIDAVLLDPWHAPAGIEAQFVEPILRLPGGRFCFQPVPWTPLDVAQAPHLATGQITFGSFNNTAKLNAGVFDVWAQILKATPNARLVLKWRTLRDAALRRAVLGAFEQRGISEARIELRAQSFHVDLLAQYADIDIALDPFPFTGGLTSCEALWMGSPLVTWPQGRAVSRQGLAFLSAIGLPDLVARDAQDYVRIATDLARDSDRLVALRRDLRARMQSSSLMDVAGLARGLEAQLIDLHQTIAAHD